MALPKGRLVEEAGFEPAAPWSQTRCAAGLRYSSTLELASRTFSRDHGVPTNLSPARQSGGKSSDTTTRSPGFPARRHRACSRAPDHASQSGAEAPPETREARPAQRGPDPKGREDSYKFRSLCSRPHGDDHCRHHDGQRACDEGDDDIPRSGHDAVNDRRQPVQVLSHARPELNRFPRMSGLASRPTTLPVR